MKKNHTDITIVLDRSGSMASVASDTIGGFNRFLKDQQQCPGTATITLHQFDDVFETPIKAVDVQSAPELTDKTFIPRGMTALLDAIGRAITDTGARLSAAGDDWAEKVVFVIITDGIENSSREYNQAKVHEMIEHQRTKYNWEFVFLGANQDAIKAGSGLGVSPANSMTYAANAAGTQSAFSTTSVNLCAMRCGTAASMAYSQQDRDEQAKAGVTSANAGLPNP
jgi:hypothetical protein